MPFSLLPLLAALAVGQPADSHQALFLEARTAESDLRYDDAHRACTAAIDADPDGPRVRTCRARLDWMGVRRDPDGGFDGLRALQTVRREFRKLEPSEAVARVQAIAADETVGDLVRVDARVWLARDALERREDPATALTWTEPVVATHEGPLRKSAVGLHARALALLGRADEALDVEAEIAIDSNNTRRTPAQLILFEQRRTLATRVSLGVVALFGAVSAPLAWRAGTEGRQPLGWIPLLVLAGGAGLIARAWADGAGAAAPFMALGFVGVHTLAGPALRPLTGWRRALLAGFAALATAATTVLALVFTGTLDWVLP